jgi:Ca2+:H+ antiporter
LVLGYLVEAPAPWVFVSAALAIVPLAEWIRRATEQMARLAGPAVGGLLNVTFGNLAELILALFVLAEGSAVVVKGQITGSIIGNSLLGLGLAVLVGSWGREKQTFERARAGQLSSLLILAVVALLLPALFDYTVATAPNVRSLDEELSLGVSGVLILVYAANLVYTLVTHRDVFAVHGGERQSPDWSLPRTLAVLVTATAVTALEAELVAKALESTAAGLGMSTFFLGVTVLAVVGNAPEYFSAVYFARRGEMDLAVGITVGSTIQVALLIAPLLVIVSFVMGRPMNLVFGNPIELFAITGAAFIVNAIAQDGETTWFEGLLLLAVYVLLALAFFFVTPPA